MPSNRVTDYRKSLNLCLPLNSVIKYCHVKDWKLKLWWPRATHRIRNRILWPKHLELVVNHRVVWVTGFLSWVPCDQNVICCHGNASTFTTGNSLGISRGFSPLVYLSLWETSVNRENGHYTVNNQKWIKFEQTLNVTNSSPASTGTLTVWPSSTPEIKKKKKTEN